MFAAVADEDTGASDLAGMLADQGVRTLLILDADVLDDGGLRSIVADAIVFATATRALTPARAFDLTEGAIRRAANLLPRTIQIKYCSTFDSTAEGNIGPSLDAAMSVPGETFTIAVPALPVNGRTTYYGCHFVKGELLSESPMRHHPLTPMTDPNLVRHLQRQTTRRVGLTPCTVVEEGAVAIAQQWERQRAAGDGIAVVDCIDDRQAHSISEAACELHLVSGSSLFGMHMPEQWRRRGWLPSPPTQLWTGLDFQPGSGQLVVAGSCSVATKAQNQWLEKAGATVVETDVCGLLHGEPDGFVGRAVQRLKAGGTVLLKTRSNPEDIALAQQWGMERGWAPSEMGRQISAAMGELVQRVLDATNPEVLICAGGETASSICRALGIRAFAVERNIQPGVPLCRPLGGRSIPMVLESGNFGTADFYGAALQVALRARA